MSKVYVLTSRHRYEGSLEIEGVVSRFDIAEKFLNIRNEILHHSFKTIELDDPELLNRIAKESEKK